MRTIPFDEARALDADHVMQTYGRLPVAFVRGEGTLLFDSEGTRYLDFLSGLAVTSLGHAHPEVAELDEAELAAPPLALHVGELGGHVARRGGLDRPLLRGRARRQDQPREQERRANSRAERPQVWSP